ncbi:hypothetical protein CMV_004585 [Castanea mollissima]|uniref:Uncharacterized protein n=1 Tax=Castanea mollissima TaxID=60419 RepID=A0A8J4RYF7_9ROSI|nr:hypothetical protein CMV_004585 [Castanea mollissima]
MSEAVWVREVCSTGERVLACEGKVGLESFTLGWFAMFSPENKAIDVPIDQEKNLPFVMIGGDKWMWIP